MFKIKDKEAITSTNKSIIKDKVNIIITNITSSNNKNTNVKF